MKFALDSAAGAYVIRGYDPGSIRIGDSAYHEPLLVMPDRLDCEWQPGPIDQLTARHILHLLQFRPEVVVVGTGAQQVFPPTRVFADLIDARVGYEVMATAAACRTYNVLLGEGRRVLGALFP